MPPTQTIPGFIPLNPKRTGFSFPTPPGTRPRVPVSPWVALPPPHPYGITCRENNNSLPRSQRRIWDGIPASRARHEAVTQRWWQLQVPHVGGTAGGSLSPPSPPPGALWDNRERVVGMGTAVVGSGAATTWGGGESATCAPRHQSHPNVALDLGDKRDNWELVTSGAAPKE